MQELVEKIVSALVERPEDVKVREIQGKVGVLIEIEVHPSDRRFVIGKQGRNIEAIRHILSCVGVARNLKVRVHLVGDEPGS